MVIIMMGGASDEQIAQVMERVVASGFRPHRSDGASHTVIGCVGEAGEKDPRPFELLPGVREVVRISEPYKLASRAFRKEPTIVRVGDASLGGEDVVLMAGPCAVESREQVQAIAPVVKRAGAKILRGGAFKPRTSPYAFQGLGEEGLRILRDAADGNGLAVVSEVMHPSQVSMMCEYVDVLQIGARNMQNFDLLKEVGRAKRPVLLKRGLAATLQELLLAAEYILVGGNPNVILCERGIRTFETSTRNTFDILAIPVLKTKSHLPVVADPSHATGVRDKVAPAARAAVAAGADGLLVEVHPEPERALCDGPQSLTADELTTLAREIGQIAAAIGRRYDMS